MEFNEKLHELRKQNGLTQEELAGALYVSRTAISKWESGRGYPSIDSLKAISAFFSVSVDELISSDEILTIANEEQKQTKKYFSDLVFGLLDVCVALLLFLPFFAVRGEGVVNSFSLLTLTGIQGYLRIAYFSMVLLTVIFGILTLALQSVKFDFWIRSKAKLSIAISIVSLLLFVVSSQPYPALFVFALLSIKVFIAIKGK